MLGVKVVLRPRPQGEARIGVLGRRLEALADIASAGLQTPTVTRHRGVARFESLEAWLHTEIRGWTLADAIDDDGFAKLLDHAHQHLADLAESNGVSFGVSALVVSGSPSQ